jgi:class 3 adenylate cyclase
VLERDGGTVEKFIGDAVMAVFGVPRVHEDDAMRGVRAAHELQQLLGRMNDELLRDKYGVGLVLRIGVNTGEDYRIALALGARVGAVSGSGGAASALLKDPLWAATARLTEIAPEPEALRDFLTDV